MTIWNAWEIYLNDKCIDTVFYTTNCTIEYVKDTLINHDGYSPNIIVQLRGK